MPKRAAEEAPPSLESCSVGPDFFGYYGAQVAELLSQQETLPYEAAKSSTTEIIGAELSNLKKERLNFLLRQCVRDLNPEVDEMQLRTHSLCLMSQLRNKKPSLSPNNSESVMEEVEDDIQLLMKSDPDLVKEIVSKHKNDLLAKLNNMQLQLETLLDNVVTTCRRPMTCGEKRDLQKSIKKLPGKNLERVAEIVKNHYVALGKEVSDEVLINLEEEDKILLWRLHFYVGAVKSAQKLSS